MTTAIRTFAAGAVALLSAAVLSACTTASSIDRVASMEATGDAFTRALHAEYTALASKEAGFDDWFDVGLFLDKAAIAAAGTTPPPENLEDWSIWDEAMLAQLAQARADLMETIDGESAGLSPELLARAQGSFDCWVEEAQEGPPHDGPVADHQPQELEKCRDAYLAAMNGIAALAIRAGATIPERPRVFIVYFAWDKAELSPLAKSLLNDIAIEAQMQAPASIAIAGYADTSGTATYNLKLSRQRAEAVAAYLAAQGIDSTVFATQWFGQEQLAVQTDDNVREEGNRRVEIAFE